MVSFKPANNAESLLCNVPHPLPTAFNVNAMDLASQMQIVTMEVFVMGLILAVPEESASLALACPAPRVRFVIPRPANASQPPAAMVKQTQVKIAANRDSLVIHKWRHVRTVIASSFPNAATASSRQGSSAMTATLPAETVAALNAKRNSAATPLLHLPLGKNATTGIPSRETGAAPLVNEKAAEMGLLKPCIANNVMMATP